jgi:ATP/maltotriose-dependent transcriptional regulator MalT
MTERLVSVSDEMVSAVAKETRFKQLAVYQPEGMGEQGLSAFTTVRVLDTNNNRCFFLVEDGRLDNPFIISPVQLEILSLRAEGFSGVQISRQLLISHQTVSNHLTNLLNRNEELYGKRRTVTQFCVWTLATGMIEDNFLATLKQIVEELGYPWR